MKQRKFRRILSAVTAVMLLSLSTGCARDPLVNKQQRTVEITLSWWGNDARNEYTLEAVEQFESLHPDIRVNCSYSEWSGYEARSKVHMASGTEADVMQINFNWLPQYSADGSGYYDLEKLRDTIHLENFTEEQLVYGRRNGILNAIPIAMNTETVYINQTIYQKYGLESPSTWDDLFTAAEKMRGDGIFPIAGASKSIWLYLIAYAEQCSGKTFFAEDGSFQFTAAELQSMIEMYVRMVQEKVLPQVEYFSRNDIDNGKYAGAIAWVSDAANYFNASIQAGNEIHPAAYTNIDPKESGKGWYAKPATLYAISKNTERPQEAAMLLDFLLNSQEMTILQGVEKGIPLSRSAKKFLQGTDLLSGIQYEASQKMDGTASMAILEPFLEGETVVDAFIEACNQVLFDKASVEDASFELYQSICSDLK